MVNLLPTINTLDLFIFQQINQFAFKYLWLDTLAIFFAKYFGYILVLFLLVFLLKNFKKYWQMVVQAFLAATLVRFVIVEIIRYFLPRVRPFALPSFDEQNLGGFVENSINLLINHSQEASFPSGHASFFFAVSTVVYLYNKKAGLLFFIASFLISISRIFIGIHWPSDILTGAIVGVLSAFFITLSFRKFSSAVK